MKQYLCITAMIQYCLIPELILTAKETITHDCHVSIDPQLNAGCNIAQENKTDIGAHLIM